MYNINRVLIEKPNLQALSKKYTVFDLHFHTRYSDGNNSVKEVGEKARELGICIAITDHNDIRGAVEIWAMKNIVSIPGIEITSVEGAHLLIYFCDIKSLKQFYKKEVFPFLGNDIMSSLSIKMEEIIMRAKPYKAITIFPHPIGTIYTGVCNSNFSQDSQEKLLNIIDGIEVFNASILKKSNLRSTILGFNLNKYITAGSDGHSLEHMGKAVTYAKCKKNGEAFFQAIIKKQNRVIGKELAIHKKVTANGMKLKSSIKNYPELIEKNMRYGYAIFNVKSKKIRANVRNSFEERLRNNR